MALPEKDKVVGSITLLVEQKFILNFSKWGHIQDVVTRKEYERMGVGKMHVKKTTDIAKKMGCSKIMLSCRDDKMEFYEKCGYQKQSNSMRLDINWSKLAEQ